MSNVDILGLNITNMYVSLIKNTVKSKYPNFFFERGAILYDEINESYVYNGYSNDEQRILKEAEKILVNN